MEKLKVIRLDITDWGMSLGGEHYYAKMWYRDDGEWQSLELYTKLTAKDAKYLNEKDGEDLYTKGDSSLRFNTINDAVKEALCQSQKLGIEVDLILSNFGSASVSEALWSKDKKIAKRINELYTKAEKIGWYSSNRFPNKIQDEKMEAIDSEFHNILETGEVK